MSQPLNFHKIVWAVQIASESPVRTKPPMRPNVAVTKRDVSTSRRLAFALTHFRRRRSFDVCGQLKARSLIRHWILRFASLATARSDYHVETRRGADMGRLIGDIGAQRLKECECK